MLILFFDTYIVSGIGDKGGIYNSQSLIRGLSGIRDIFHTYRWQRKIDVVKYTLASYSKIKWDKVIIRFECEDQDETSGFSAYCRELFPSAGIFNERSATAAKYFDALSAINECDDIWIFFSPNNDHPYLAEPGELSRLVLIADKISDIYPSHTVSLLYSHLTESMNDNRMTDPQWGYFGFKFKKVIYEDNDVIVNMSNIAPLDSIQIFRLGYLKKIFSTTKNMGRVIRLEDTEFCSSKNHNVIQICPKIELCRHYDSYEHIMDYVPPLFIPDGFFEKNIKIRYGYDEGRKDWVNINPLKSTMTADVDLQILSDDMPHFWLDRISEIDINPLFPQNLHKSDLAYYNNIHNPWGGRTKLFNLARSLYIFIFLQGKAVIRKLIRFVLIKVGVFESLKTIKRRFFS